MFEKLLMVNDSTEWNSVVATCRSLKERNSAIKTNSCPSKDERFQTTFSAMYEHDTHVTSYRYFY